MLIRLTRMLSRLKKTYYDHLIALMFANHSRSQQSKRLPIQFFRNLKRQQLTDIITAVLVKSTNPDGARSKCPLDAELPQKKLHYFQGYHDVVSVLLLTLGENLGFYAADSLSRLLIRDYMLKNFEGGVMPLMKLLMQLLKEINPRCYDIMKFMGDIPTFSLSWVLTWFSHDIDEFAVVQRIFDACLS